MCDIFELLTLSLLQEMCSFWVLLCFNILFRDVVGSMYTAIHKIIALNGCVAVIIAQTVFENCYVKLQRSTLRNMNEGNNLLVLV